MTAKHFAPATADNILLRLALVGPAGTGKTWTSLAVGTELCKLWGFDPAVSLFLVDTEKRSSKKYARQFRFQACYLDDSQSPHEYVDALHAAADAGAKVLVVDSLSHAWMGRDGALEQVDRAAQKSGRNDSFGSWRHVTPQHNQLVDALLSFPGHLIATMRAKTAYEVEKDANGRTKVTKLGLAAVQREGVDYEFDVVGDMDVDNTLSVGKTRCSTLKGRHFDRPGRVFAKALYDWIEDGDATPTAEPATGTISGEQVAELDGLIADTQSDLPKFLKHFQCGDSLAGMTVDRFPQAVKMLQAKAAKLQVAAAAPQNGHTNGAAPAEYQVDKLSPQVVKPATLAGVRERANRLGLNTTALAAFAREHGLKAATPEQLTELEAVMLLGLLNHELQAQDGTANVVASREPGDDDYLSDVEAD